MNGESSTRRYYGFDTFSGYTEEDLKSNKHLSKGSFSDTSIEFVSERLKKQIYQVYAPSLKEILEILSQIFCITLLQTDFRKVISSCHALHRL